LLHFRLKKQNKVNSPKNVSFGRKMVCVTFCFFENPKRKQKGCRKKMNQRN